jgi:hypothetical protein
VPIADFKLRSLIPKCLTFRGPDRPNLLRAGRFYLTPKPTQVEVGVRNVTYNDTPLDTGNRERLTSGHNRNRYLSAISAIRYCQTCVAGLACERRMFTG